MAEAFWFALGFIVATFLWNSRFKGWVLEKLGRKPKAKVSKMEQKPEEVVEVEETVIRIPKKKVVKEIKITDESATEL